MTIPLIRFVVTCPTCGAKQSAAFNAAELADALISSKPIRLYASCHDISWNASEPEVQAIRDHIYKAAIESERGNVTKH